MIILISLVTFSLLMIDVHERRVSSMRSTVLMDVTKRGRSSKRKQRR